MKLFKPKPLSLNAIEPDVRTPIRVAASRRLRAFALCAQAAGAAAIAAWLWQGDFSTQFVAVVGAISAVIWAGNALNTGIFSQYRARDFVAFGIHAAARPDVFDMFDDESDAHYSAPGTVATVARRELLDIFVQTRAGDVLHGQLAATQFVAPFFCCIRFTLYSDVTHKVSRWQRLKSWFQPTQEILLLPDNIDAEEFRQCRVLLRWT